jgi:hypothetical protein
MTMGGRYHNPAALLPGKNCRYPLNRRVGGFQNQTGGFEEVKNLLPLPRLKYQQQSFSPGLPGLPNFLHVE